MQSPVLGIYMPFYPQNTVSKIYTAASFFSYVSCSLPLYRKTLIANCLCGEMQAARGGTPYLV
jgi:hypothetical protein